MNSESNQDLQNYNEFFENLTEGTLLYNIDSTNQWGDYFLVANIATVKLQEQKTFTALLIGLKKEGNTLVPRNIRIKLTPDYAKNIPFLKKVGYCKFRLFPELEEINLNLGLATVYGNTDLWKFREKLSVRKPKTRKYGKDGKLIIKKAGN